MLFGHGAVGVIAHNTLFRNMALPILLVAAYGPDWVDKPLKLFFDLPGHGVGHSGLVFACLCLSVFSLRRRIGAHMPLAAACLGLWAAHLLCDWILPEVLFWPLLGPLPNSNYGVSTLELASGFYAWPRMHPLAWIDLCLIALAAATSARRFFRGRRLHGRVPAASAK